MSDASNLDPYQTPDAALDRDSSDDALLRQAIGPNNTEFYLAYLHAAEGQRWKPSWHWPAFFVTSPWLLYRKMWAGWLLYTFVFPFALLLLVFPVALLAAIGASEVVVGLIANVVMFAGYFLLPPVLANAFYKRKVESLLRRAAKAGADREQQLAWLDKHGGTSWLWLVLLLGGVMLLGILAAVAIPAYQDYLENVEMARQLQEQMQQSQLPSE